MSEVVKVKRDGPRGWHLIAAANYDPAVHELFDAPAAKAEPVKRPAPSTAHKKKGAN